MTELKTCTKCGRELPLTEFHRRNKKTDALRPRCKQCRNEERREWETNNPDSFAKVRESQRMCTLVWRAENQKHVKEIAAKYRTENRKKRNAQSREYRINNQDKMKELQLEWRGRNPHYDAKRRENNPKLKINNTISACIGSALKRKGGYNTKNGRRWESIVGYTLEDLIKHLEKQFTDEMNWGNQGSYWHIDHKIPIAVFNFETPEDIDFKRCWALKNLQPLEAIENLRKSAKLSSDFQPSLALRLSA